MAGKKVVTVKILGTDYDNWAVIYIEEGSYSKLYFFNCFINIITIIITNMITTKNENH